MLNALDLFSGIGGITEALAEYVRPVAYCERDPKCQDILLSRQYRGEIPSAPICTDVYELRAIDLPSVDIIYGGFPCQNVSVAGLRQGLGGVETQHFWQIVRLTKETKAPFVFIENVWPGIRKHIPTIRYAFEILMGLTNPDTKKE